MRAQLRRTASLVLGGIWGNEAADSDEDVAVVRVADFDYPSLAVTRAPTVRSVPRPLQQARRLHAGDLLIEKSGGGDRQNVGRVVRFDAAGPAVYSNFIALLRPAPGFDERYLAYLHRALYAQGVATALTKQATGIQNLDLGAYLATVVEVPTLGEQRTISNFLGRECERIADLRRAVKAVEDRGIAVARALFDELTANRRRIRLRYRISLIEQGWSPECEDREPAADEWGVLKLGCVNEGRFSYQAKTLGAGPKPRPELSVSEGDVLMSRANTRELVGSCAVVTSEIRARTMLSDLLYRLRPDGRTCTPEYLAVALGAPSARWQIEALAIGAAGSMPKMSQRAIKQLTVPDIGLVEQQQILATLDSELRPLSAVRHEGKRLRTSLLEYRDALITEAVTGALDVTRLSDQQLDESARAAIEGEKPEVLSA